MGHSKGGVKKGQDLGGVRTLEDLRLRSVVDEVTGCWNLRGAQKRGGAVVWLPATQRSETLTSAMAILMTGKKAEPGSCWFATCGNRACCNPAHRKLGTRIDAQRACDGGRKSPQHRKLIADRMRARYGYYSPELRHEILTSSETATAIAQRTGMHLSAVCRIRRGEAWRDHAAGATVFELGGGL